MPEDRPTTFSINGYEITDHNNGFQAWKMSRIAAYLAVKRPVVYGFAFCIDDIASAVYSNTISPNEFEESAKGVIQDYLSQDDLEDRKEYTFEYDFNRKKFSEVQDSAWWQKSSGI